MWNVSSVNAVGGACYTHIIDDDTQQEIENCERDANRDRARLTCDIEHFKKVHRVELEVNDQELRKTNDCIVKLENILTDLL